jgi:hypothetical protein
VIDTDEAALRAMGASIESIGRNCEFGAIQHDHLGVDPISLLRWAGSSLPLLTEALRNGFAGFTDEMTGHGVPPWEPPERQHWWLTDARYDMVFHTHEGVATTPLARAVEKTRPRLLKLRDMLLESIEAGDKLFLYSDKTLTSPAGAAALFDAFAALGPSFLLLVLANPGKAGTAAYVDDRFIVGYVDFLTEAGQANTYRWTHWPRMLVRAHAIWQRHRPKPVSPPG